MASSNNRLNKKKRYVEIEEHAKGTTLWDNRHAGEKALFGRPTWMAVPGEVVEVDGGPRKRAIIRQFEARSPLTGKMVQCRELGPPTVYAWEDPERGFIFGFCLDATDMNGRVIDGGEGP